MEQLRYFVIAPVRWLLRRICTERLLIKIQFLRKCGRNIDLDNPKTLNEKIQWLKLNDRTVLHTLCADKYAVREYIKIKIGNSYLIPLIYHTDNPADITIERMPDFPCIIKTTHDTGGRVIIKDKYKINWTEVRKILALRLKRNYYYAFNEWQYKNIKPNIVVEKLLLNKTLDVPSDYKCHCANGKVIFIQVDINRHTDHRRNIYDPDWELLDCQWLRPPAKDNVAKPVTLNKMKSLAQTLAKDFYYVRVDFYSVGNRIYFGELTFHPESGFEKFTPPEWDRIFGDKLMLTK